MRPETNTLLEFLDNAGIQSYLFEAPFEAPEQFDLGLRHMLIHVEHGPYDPILRRLQRMKPFSLYHLQDAFLTHYAIARLPEEETEQWLSIGPMLYAMPAGEEVLSMMERMHLPAGRYHDLIAYYERLPKVQNQEVFEALCCSIADTVFSGRDQYTVKLIHNSQEPDALQQLLAHSDPLQEETQEQKFARIENRYARENDFLKAVMTGDSKLALQAHTRFAQFGREVIRMPDRLRDKKDLGISLNTLLRKTAEDAGVHPFYIDALSNANVVRLENVSNEIEFGRTCRELVEDYCDLIHQYALKSFSKPVQDAIFLIQSDLSSDLTLSAIAEKLNLNRSYLSTLFCKEVGQTLSAYILEKRIRRAQHLLSITPLSIQEIAWEVGIPDANYFARLFKRETGVTPKRHRETTRNHTT